MCSGNLEFGRKSDLNSGTPGLTTWLITPYLSETNMNFVDQ
jgi:hypothetical protein